MRNADSSYARFACKECVMRNFSYLLEKNA